jgi:hypothetical protein
MGMHVPGYSRTARGTFVDADVETVRRKGIFEDILGKRDQVHQIDSLVCPKITQARNFAKRDCQQMAGIVGILVQDKVRVLGSMNNVHCPIVPVLR